MQEKIKNICVKKTKKVLTKVKNRSNLIINNLKRGGSMERFINKLDYDFYIKSFMRPLSRFDKFYLMSKNDTV